MIRHVIVCFLVVIGLFRQTITNPMSVTVSSHNKLALDMKNIQPSIIGSYAQNDMSNCKCPNNVTVNETNYFGIIQYVTDSPHNCCTYCVTVISAPPGYQVQATSSANFQNDSNASLTMRNGNGKDGYILGKLGNCDNGYFLSSTNAMTVIFSRVDSTPCFLEELYGVTASPHGRQKLSPTTYSLSSARPFHLILRKEIDSSPHYWIVKAETGKKVHLYLFGLISSSNDNHNTVISIIDGSNIKGTLILQVTQLSPTYGLLNATSSSGSSLTVLVETGPSIPSPLPDVNFLFTQLEKDPSECGTPEFGFLTSDNSSPVNVSMSNHGTGAASCPTVLIIYTANVLNPGMHMTVNSLQGDMTLYAGLNYWQSSNNEIISFSS
uniref:Uncharacterized protein n=1 Tax=Plectus sambesii TaxID=2011161 RepID=A0A914VV75_9BILA